MRIFPVLIDARPSWLGTGEHACSLLLAPLGRGTVAEHLAGGLARITSHPVSVLAAFPPDPAYEASLTAALPSLDAVVHAARLTEWLRTHKPSDWLLVLDSRRVPDRPFDLAGTLREIAKNPRVVRHVVDLATTAAGVAEHVVFDDHGQVARVQRYYESRTLHIAAGVVCSLLPVASLLALPQPAFESLRSLRANLAAREVPSADARIDSLVFDLTQEEGLLALAERILVRAVGRRGHPLVAPGASVHRGARLVGAVVVQEGAVIEADVAIIGPSVVGRGARVGEGAILAQSLVLSGATIEAGARIQRRVVTAGPPLAAPSAAAPDPAFAPPPGSGRPDEPVGADGAYTRYLFLRRSLEAVVAFTSLAALSPLLLAIAALVKRDSPGPVFFAEEREGRGGRNFNCWKFRTMVRGAEGRQRRLQRTSEVDGPQFKMRDDPRITPVGRWLRRFNLDELPQLWNVLRGEMSLVGPRPSPFHENQICIPWRESRLSVSPGMTGLWQVCRDRTVAADFHQWIYYDLLYVQNLSPWLDLKILAVTLLTLGGRRRVRLDRLLLPSQYFERRSVPRS